MKAKHAIILLALGYCVDFIAAFYKIEHWRGADQFFAAGTVLKVAGVILLAYKLITSRQLRDFMNQ